MLQYTVFITGANRGLGLEFVRQYAGDNWRVLASCRNLVQAKDLQTLAQHFKNITLLQLDVTNGIQLNQLAQQYRETPIDLLINNAGIYTDDDFGAISTDTMKQAFLTNAVAPLKVSETFISNISRSHLKTIIALSSRVDKDSNRNESYSHRASKTALNLIMKNLALDLKEKNIKVFTLHPGSVKTETGGPYAIMTPEQSVSNMRTLLLRLTHRETGMFYDHLGNVI